MIPGVQGTISPVEIELNAFSFSCRKCLEGMEEKKEEQVGTVGGLGS